MGYSKIMYQEMVQERMVEESMRAELHWMEQEFLYSKQKKDYDISHTRWPQVGQE